MKKLVAFAFAIGLILGGAASSEAKIYRQGSKPMPDDTVQQSSGQVTAQHVERSGGLQWTPAVRGTHPHVPGGFRDADDFLAFTGEQTYGIWANAVARANRLSAQDAMTLSTGNVNVEEVTVFQGSQVRNMTTATGSVPLATVAEAPAQALLLTLPSGVRLAVFKDCGNTGTPTANFNYVGLSAAASATRRRSAVQAQPERQPMERERELRDYRSTERDYRSSERERIVIQQAQPSGPTAEELELERLRMERERLALRREQLEMAKAERAQLERERKEYAKLVRAQNGGGRGFGGRDILEIGGSFAAGLLIGRNTGHTRERVVYRDRLVQQPSYRPILIQDNQNLPIHVGDPGTPGSPYAPPPQDGHMIDPRYGGSGLDPFPPGYVPPQR